MLSVCPITLKEARQFVSDHHRHNPAPVGGLFAIAAESVTGIAAVAIVGRPIARHLQDGYTCEVTRLCSDGTRNACSMLYAACWRAARAMGYRRMVTYTRDSEPGTTLKAAGWRDVAHVKAESWHRKARPRVDTAPLQAKIRWERTAEAREETA